MQLDAQQCPLGWPATIQQSSSGRGGSWGSWTGRCAPAATNGITKHAFTRPESRHAPELPDAADAAAAAAPRAAAAALPPAPEIVRQVELIAVRQ